MSSVQQQLDCGCLFFVRDCEIPHVALDDYCVNMVRFGQWVPCLHLVHSLTHLEETLCVPLIACLYDYTNKQPRAIDLTSQASHTSFMVQPWLGNSTVSPPSRNSPGRSQTVLSSLRFLQQGHERNTSQGKYKEKHLYSFCFFFVFLGFTVVKMWHNLYLHDLYTRD